MKIATKLNALTLCTTFLSVAIAASLLWQDHQQQQHFKRLDDVFRIQVSIDSLRAQLLTFRSTQDPAVLKSSHEIDAELKTLLENAPHINNQQQIYLQSLAKQNDSVCYLLDQMIDLHSGGPSPQVDQASQHLVNLLTGVVQSMTEDSIRLEQHAVSDSKQLRRETHLMIGGLLFAFTLLLWGMSINTSRSFRNRIALLDKGIRQLSDGDTNSRIHTHSRDEIGEVAQHFNDMTDQLRATTVSRDQLQAEVDKRTRELNSQKQALKQLADHDQLTDLPNRAYFRQSLASAIGKNKRAGTSAAVFFMDLDKFKQINDSLGHHIGDEVLQEVSRRFRNRLRSSDFIARLGGDEFTVIIDPLPNPQSAAQIARQLLLCLKAPLNIEEHELHLRTSIGISIFPEDGDDVSTLMRNADLAMYKAKEDGGNTFHFYNQAMTHDAVRKISLEEELRQALKQHQLSVYYQPQYSLDNKRLVGVEALARWIHPEEGIIHPQEFIPLAEERGLIQNLGMQILEMACQQCSLWMRAGIDPGVLAVNLSARQLNHPHLRTQITEILERTDWPATRLELEVTESFFIKDPNTCLGVLNELRELGIKLAIDDFGTGYSSLSYLKKLPISKLKIDRSFTRDLIDDAEDRAISMAIIALGKSLGLQVIAEGVEKQGQEDILVSEGCDQVQGFLYGKPMPAEQFPDCASASLVLNETL